MESGDVADPKEANFETLKQMAVSGPIPDSVSLGSAEDSDNSCEPCLTIGLHAEGHGFCVDCKEYLCKNCFDYHKRTKGLRNHQLLGKDNVEKQIFTRKDSDECTEKCSVHKTEIIKFFCPTHEALCCNDCIIMYHRTCKIDYIPEKCAGIGDSDDYREIVKNLDQKMKEAEIVAKKTEIKDNEVDKCHSGIVKEILIFRKEINDRFDQLQQEIQKDADKKKSNDKRLIQMVFDECATNSSDIKNLQSSLKADETSRQNGQLYISIKRAERQLKSDKLKNAFENLARRNMQYSFKRNTVIANLLLKQDVFGELNLTASLATPVKKENINLRTGSGECYITGCAALPPNKFVLVDHDNTKMKVVDAQSKAVIEEKALDSKPWDIAVLPRDQIAVTIPEKSLIQVLTTSGKLSAVCSMPVKGECYGITYHQGYLYVVCQQPKCVLVLDTQGNVQNTISLTNNTFNIPQYIALSEDSKNIYISDFGSHCIASITIKDDVSVIYRHKDLYGPRGMLMLEDGSLLVCSYWNGTIHHISGDLKQCLKMICGLRCPTSICHSLRHDEAYVGSVRDLLQVLGRK